jgi:hypothetical protein
MRGVCKYKRTGSFIELGMVGESYESTSWRSGPLSIVSSQKKVEHVNTERVAVGDFTDLKAKTEFSSG